MSREPAYVRELAEVLRLVLVAGLATGIVVIGIGSRLAMLALRLTSPDSVLRVRSDDGFTIGEVTLAGTYNLIIFGAAVGVIGAAAYIAVAPWLIGPPWLRRVTVSVAAGAIGGSMLVHYEGVDFQLLGPLWFALSLFIALPTLAGLALSVAVDAVAAPHSVTRRGHWCWAMPVTLLALVPLTLPVVVPVALLVTALLPLRRRYFARLWSSPRGRLIIRGAFLAVALGGFVALGSDLRQFGLLG